MKAEAQVGSLPRERLCVSGVAKKKKRLQERGLCGDGTVMCLDLSDGYPNLKGMKCVELSTRDVPVSVS